MRNRDMFSGLGNPSDQKARGKFAEADAESKGVLIEPRQNLEELHMIGNRVLITETMRNLHDDHYGIDDAKSRRDGAHPVILPEWTVDFETHEQAYGENFECPDDGGAGRKEDVCWAIFEAEGGHVALGRLTQTIQVKCQEEST